MEEQKIYLTLHFSYHLQPYLFTGHFVPIIRYWEAIFKIMTEKVLQRKNNVIEEILSTSDMYLGSWTCDHYWTKVVTTGEEKMLR